MLQIGPVDIHNIFYNGWMGVELFFVLSGFLITSQLLTKNILKGNLKNFFYKRFFRIAPAYFVSIFLVLFFLHVLPQLHEKTLTELLYIWWLPITSHLLFLHDFFGRQPIIEGLYWSLPIEMKFYLLLPFVLIALQKIKSQSTGLLMLCLYVLYLALKTLFIYSQYGFEAQPYLHYFLYAKSPFFLALEGLMTGVLCAFFYKSDRFKTIEQNALFANILCISGLALFFFIALQPHFTHLPYATGTNATFSDMTVIPFAISLSCGMILISLIKGCFLNKFLEHSSLKFIAQISFSLYLTHTLALPILMLYGFMSYTPTLWLISIPTYLMLSFCYASLLYITVEKPAQDWSRKKFKYKDTK